MSEAKFLEGARALVERCARLRQGERVYILSDRETEPVGRYVAAEARRWTSELIVHVVPEAPMHGTEPSSQVAERMSWANVVFCLTRMSLAHTAARKAATDRGTRYLSLPDYSLDLLAARSLQVDFASLEPLARDLTSRLDGGRSIELRTRLGSQLRVSIDGRQGNCCPGLCDRDGMLGSPPDAEANIAPIEDGSEGIVWVDGSIPCRSFGKLAEPIGLEIVRGRIVRLHGRAGDVAKLEHLFDAAHLTATRVLAEFGFGLNPLAELSGRMLEDEGCAGTIHLGFGSNATIGGRNRVPFHLDFVVTQPSVWIDGVPILQDGQMNLKAAA